MQAKSLVVRLVYRLITTGRSFMKNNPNRLIIQSDHGLFSLSLKAKSRKKRNKKRIKVLSWLKPMPRKISFISKSNQATALSRPDRSVQAGRVDNSDNQPQLDPVCATVG